MHIFSSIILILGAIIVLVLGLVSVLHDLLERGPHDAPLMQDEGPHWARRLPAEPLTRRQAADRGIGGNGLGESPWPNEHENNRV